jgi:PKD repeat protein
VPPLSGTSTFAQTVTLTASPTTLRQDGTSISSIALSAVDATKGPMKGLTFVMTIGLGCAGPPIDPKNPPPPPAGDNLCSGGLIADFGSLANRTLVTDANGQATTTYLAPAPPPPLDGGAGTIVSILATPKFDSGNTYQNFLRQQRVDIQLVPPGVILPPASTPTPLFTFAPSAPIANSPVQFDATASCPGDLATITPPTCAPAATAITAYNWDFGDGATATGPVVKHSFALQQSYTVILTVINDRNRSASKTQVVLVGAGGLPTPAFVFGPTPVQLNTPVNFDATASRPGPGHQIMTYTWNWGDGTPSGGGVTTSHSFRAAGVFAVVLTVTDEAGQQGTISQTVNVGTGAPNAVFTFGVTNALTHTLTFDGSGSTALGTATIDPATGYAWAFGDGLSGTGAIVSHPYAFAGTYTVRLTVTDSLGRTGSSTQIVTVP